MKTSIVYHKVDLDGKCSAAILKRAHPHAELVPYNYGDDFVVEEYRDTRVVMIDCSLQPYERMVELADACDLIWIDHHKTAIEEYEKNSIKEAVLDSKRAGCELAWGWAFPDQPMPRAVRLLGRYDIWDHSDFETLPFQYGMRRHDADPDDELFWKTLFFSEAMVDKIIEEGKIILDYTSEWNKSACKSSFEARFEDMRCICMNAPRCNSQVFESVWDPEKHDAMLAFFYNGKYWTIGMYSTKVDVGAVAKKHGGGGHEKAAGFQCAELPRGILPAGILPAGLVKKTEAKR